MSVWRRVVYHVCVSGFVGLGFCGSEIQTGERQGQEITTAKGGFAKCLVKALITAVALPVLLGVACGGAVADTPADSVSDTVTIPDPPGGTLPFSKARMESAARDDNGGSACLADFDGNGRVGFADFVAFASVFGLGSGDVGYNGLMDLDGNGRVGFADFVAFASVFGGPCVAAPASDDREALVALYNATDGPNWSNKENWLSDRPLNEWHGVFTDAGGRVTALHLGWNALTGAIPPELGSLTNLRELDLEWNQLTGAIPPWLGSLTNLERLLLNWSQLSGPIPPELGSLTNLKTLWLDGNQLWGAIPPELANLTHLYNLCLSGNQLSGAIPPELANLTHLYNLCLSGNQLSGPIPPELGSLTNLNTLDLGSNELTGAIPPWLGSLTNLRELRLAWNQLSGPIPPELGSLTNLEMLELAGNDLTGAIPPELGNLTNLQWLDLAFNIVTDVRELVGLTNLEWLDLRGNPLNDASVNHHIPALRGNGLRVNFDLIRESDFDIELVFLDAYTESQKRILNYVAKHWTSLITADVPDYEFTLGWSDSCGGRSFEIPSGERIDDLRIYVASHEDDDIAGWGAPNIMREESRLPVVGCMSLNLRSADLLITGLHEIAHVLGFGTVWYDLGFLKDPEGDAHFNGPLAIDAFDDAGGRDYAGAKVPLNDWAHWKVPLLNGELMGPGGGAALSAITVQSMADIGYGVDVSGADPFSLPGATAGAKVVALPRPTEREAIRAAWRRAAAEAMGARDVDFWRDRRKARLATSAEPAFTCGAGLRREPIYVIDPQGRVVHTLDAR